MSLVDWLGPMVALLTSSPGSSTSSACFTLPALLMSNWTAPGFETVSFAGSSLYSVAGASVITSGAVDVLA